MNAAERRLEDLAEQEDLDEDDYLLERMDAGLFTLQSACIIVGNLWMTQDAGLRKRMLMLLHQKSRSLDMIR